ncbi:TPA: hypothetical protein DCG35_00605 [Candidatus Edwardsbacteria bacterium]|nr:hypothetical protein [Candidatus Edwardsbacteria bacterium]
MEEKMKKFDRDNKFEKKGSSRPPSRGPKKFGPRGGKDFGKGSFDKQMHPATCDSCGTSCEVPFKPTGGKPIYCRDCFRKMEGSEAPRRFDRPERPRFSRPDRFAPREHSSPGGGDQVQKELDKINIKLDKILRALEGE